MVEVGVAYVVVVGVGVGVVVEVVVGVGVEVVVEVVVGVNPMQIQTAFEALLMGLTDQELSMLLRVTERRMRAAIGESEVLAVMLAQDIPVIKAEIIKRKANR